MFLVLYVELQLYLSSFNNTCSFAGRTNALVSMCLEPQTHTFIVHTIRGEWPKPPSAEAAIWPNALQPQTQYTLKIN